MKDKIIINGRSLAGKDIAADYLVEKYGFTKISFAKGIYEVAYKVFDMKNKDRLLLQTIGQKMREIKPTIWIEYVMREINRYPDKKWVISDCRQENEYTISVIENGFSPIRIHADYDLRVQRAIDRDGFYPDTSLWENESETGADHFEYTERANNTSLEDLYKQIDEFINK